MIYNVIIKAKRCKMKKKIFGALSTGEEVYSYRLENGKIFAEIIISKNKGLY